MSDLATKAASARSSSGTTSSRFSYIVADASTVRATLGIVLGAQLDALGVKSGQAQLLNGPITTVEKIEGSNHTTIICCDCGDDSGVPLTSLSLSLSSTSTAAASVQCVGYIKYGTKDLYFYHKNGKISQSSPLCLLDFYVDERMQRSGLGISLFRRMLEQTGRAPKDIAYDRPSPKLVTFMRKHFNLVNPDLQPNRYAIYDGFPLT
jgi:hypothetical protein